MDADHPDNGVLFACRFTVGAEIWFDRNFKLAGSFDSAFTNNAQTYAGSARLSYVW